MSRFPQLVFGALFAVLMPLPVFAQEIVLTNRQTDLRATPDDGAPSLKSLAPQTSVKVVERKGPWTRVQLDMQLGWVRMMHLRGGVIVGDNPSPAATSTGTSWMAGLNRLVGGPTKQDQRAQSATLGVRGLSAEDLRSASPDAQALNQMKSFAVTKSDAERYAQEARLATVTVAELAAEAAKGRK
jgi:hypothetical protein